MQDLRKPALLAAALSCAFACDRVHRTVDRSQEANLGDQEVVAGLVDVQLRGASPDHKAALQRYGEFVEADELRDDSLEGLLESDVADHFVLRVDPKDEQRILAELRSRDDVLYAEAVVSLQALWTPNDPEYAKQWHLGAAGAPAAWEAARGAGVVVAVVDTGIAPVDDLDAARLLPGHNTLANSADARDDQGHGTHVAGTIGQSTGNGVGTAGMAPRAILLPVKVLSASGGGTSASVADGIRWAADRGAKVINLSLGGPGHSAAMADAVAYAHRRGAVVVCAAGNTGAGVVGYPAAYPGAFAVSAVGPKGTLAPYSSFGPQIAIAAPGGDKSLGEEQGVLQETLAEGDATKFAYRFFQGTSMATPHVSGAAALLASVGVTNPAAIERILRATAREPADGANAQRYGAGLLDAGAAVRTATLWHGLFRLALALIGAFVAVSHARRLQQLRSRETMTAWFWAALGVAAGGLAVLAPMGLARLPFGELLVLPPAALGGVLVGLPHAGAFGSAAALIGYSPLVPFALASFTRALGGRGQLVAGLCFGQAGLLLGMALLRTVYLPWLPQALVPFWLGLGAVLCWMAGRGLLAGKDA